MANVNIPDLAALTAPAATDAIEVYDASAAANVRLALSYLALLGTANVFTAVQAIKSPAVSGEAIPLTITNQSTSSLNQVALVFRAHSSSVNYRAKIVGQRNSDNYGTSLNFYTQDNTSGDSLTQKMVLNKSGHLLIGTTTDSAQLTVNGAMALVDGMTAPGTTSGWAKIYVDSADGDLKVKFGDGTVKTLATDT
jgi:hypothetical protein